MTPNMMPKIRENIETFISDKTFVSWSLVVTLVGAGFSFGIMWNKMDTVVERIIQIERHVERVENKMDSFILAKPQSSVAQY